MSQLSTIVVAPQISPECSHCIMFMGFVGQALGKGRAEMVCLWATMAGVSSGKNPSVKDGGGLRAAAGTTGSCVDSHVWHLGLTVVGTPTYGLHMWTGLPPIMAASAFLCDNTGLEREMPKENWAEALLPIMN